MEENKQAIEETPYRIAQNLVMLVRDVNLTEETEAKYKIGAIVREPDFCDATYEMGGMVTTHRYAIISNHYLDTSALVEKGKMWGLCICQRNSQYRVLDIYNHKNKTQIMLLHNDEVGNLFQHIENFSEEILINECRNQFEKKCELPPIPEVTSPEWLERCAQPLGINDNNELFP